MRPSWIGSAALLLVLGLASGQMEGSSDGGSEFVGSLEPAAPMEASFELPEAEEDAPQPDLPRLAQIGAQLRSAVDGSGSAVDGSGSAVDGSGSAVDGSGSAADGSGSAGAGSGKRSMPKVKKEWRWQAVETRGNAPAPREGHTSTAVENYLVMFGGCFLDKECFNDVQVLDTEEDRWLEPAVQGRPPMGREGHTATLVQDAIYVFGGSSQAGYMNDLHVLAVGLQNAGEEMRLAWGVEDVSGTPPTAREGHTATAVGTRIFVFGGFTEQGYSSDLFVLNTDDMAWERPPVAGVPPSGREGHTATLFRDRLIIFGGFTDGGCLNDVAVLDTSTRTWVRPKVFGSPPLPRQDASAVRRGHTILYTGGCNFARQQCYRDSFVLDLRKRQWRKAEFVKEGGLAPREDHTVTLVRDRVLLFGGCFLAEKCYDDTLELITGGAWECGGNDCSGHGSCHHGICYCAAGYVGADCSMEMKCPANCSGHGSCLSTGACACRSGWSGDACETKVECPNDCSGHGVCLPNEVCRCEEGWFGAHCGLCVPKDEYVCSGHGHCVMPEGEMGEGEATAEAESAGYIPTLAGSTDAKAAAGSGSGANAAGAGAGAGSAGAGSAGAGAAPALLQLGAGASIKASAKRALRSTAAAAALAADGSSGSSGSGSGSGGGSGSDSGSGSAGRGSSSSSSSSNNNNSGGGGGSPMLEGMCKCRTGWMGTACDEKKPLAFGAGGAAAAGAGSPASSSGSAAGAGSAATADAGDVPEAAAGSAADTAAADPGAGSDVAPPAAAAAVAASGHSKKGILARLWGNVFGNEEEEEAPRVSPSHSAGTLSRRPASATSGSGGGDRSGVLQMRMRLKDHSGAGPQFRAPQAASAPAPAQAAGSVAAAGGATVLKVSAADLERDEAEDGGAGQGQEQEAAEPTAEQRALAADPSAADMVKEVDDEQTAAATAKPTAGQAPALKAEATRRMNKVFHVSDGTQHQKHHRHTGVGSASSPPLASGAGMLASAAGGDAKAESREDGSEEAMEGCPDNCGAHGECVEDRCYCKQGWMGYACGESATSRETFDLGHLLFGQGLWMAVAPALVLGFLGTAATSWLRQALGLPTKKDAVLRQGFM